MCILQSEVRRRELKIRKEQDRFWRLEPNKEIFTG